MNKDKAAAPAPAAEVDSKVEEDVDQLFLAARPWNPEASSTIIDESYATSVGTRKSVAAGVRKSIALGMGGGGYRQSIGDNSSSDAPVNRAPRGSIRNSIYSVKSRASTIYGGRIFHEADHEFRDSISGSNSSSEKSDAGGADGQANATQKEKLQHRQSVNTFLRERILYHGPVPYMDGFYENKAKYELPIPTPPRRIRPKALETDLPQVELKAVGSNDSDISNSLEASLESTFGFGLDQANIIHHEIADNKSKQESEKDLRKTPHMVFSKKAFVPPTPSLMSITEKVCIIHDEKVKPISLHERYAGAKHVHGYPQCSDKTEGYPSCLPPGDIVRKAIKTDELWGVPYNVALTKDQLLQLMRRMEDYPTSDYVCLIYSLPSTHPEFNPYSLQVVKYQDVDPKHYFTMSKYGMMLFTNGFGEFVPMLQFEKHMHLYDCIKKIPFFIQYRLWKAFFLWRYNIRHTKINQYRIQLDDSLFLTKRPLRMMIMELFKMSEKLCTMAFLSMKPRETYNLKEFLAFQDKRLKEVYRKLRQFEEMVVDMTVTACRSALIEAGFSPDEYPEEMKYYMKALEVPIGNLYAQTVDILNYPGQWLSYSLQLQKRKLCYRLTNFVHLIDYYMQRTYAYMYKNTMMIFLCELSTRIREIPEEFYKTPDYLFTLEELRTKIERATGNVVISGANEPLYNIGCEWTVDNLVFTPPRDKFIKAIKNMLTKWERTIYSYKNLLPRPVFDPYTQPIVNGSMDEKTCGDGPQMSLLLSSDPDLKLIRETTLAACNHAFDVCRSYIEQFDYIRLFCLANQATNLEKFRHEKDVRTLAKYLETFHKQMEIIKWKIEDDKSLGIFRVNNSVLRKKAYPTVKRCLIVLNHIIPLFGVHNVKKLTKRIKVGLRTLAKYPKTADEYVDYLSYLDKIQEQMEDFEQDLDICAEVYDLIGMYKIPETPEDLTAYERVSPLLTNLREIIDQRTSGRDTLIEELVEQFTIDTAAIFADMAEIKKVVEDPEVLNPDADPTIMCDRFTTCSNTLTVHQEKAAKFNNYQKLLKLEVTNFDELDALLFEVNLRHQLWDSVQQWEIQKTAWEEAPFNTLDHEELAKEVIKYVKSIHQLEKGLPANPVVPALKDKVDLMSSRLPLIANIHNPNLKHRHWEVLEKALNRDLTSDDVTLKSLIEDTGIEAYAELIQNISAQASAEFSLEALLKKVEESWKDIEFIVLPHKDQRDNFILGGTDDIQVLLDDSNIHMATIASSRHVGPIKHKVEEWARLLDLFGRTLDEWLNFQRNYLYLDTIFCAPDIQRQLPTEAKLFSQVDKIWRDIMQKTNRMPAALRAATAPGLFEQLQTGNEMLEQIMKCLDDYLESKRVIFPRFYFLSNEELLEILAQTRNPKAVQPHLRKCFDAIQKLEFGGPANAVALDVLAMFSPEEERVSLTKGLKARGNVEDWLGKVEESMFVSLKRSMRNALADYHVFEREDWLQKFPSQCVLTISQLMWAQKVHAILDAPGNKLQGMKDFEKINFENLNKLAAMVREQLPPLVRAVLCALITIDVHARDIISSLVEKKVETSSNFEWLKQLRYYWDASQEVVSAKMANAQYYYGYEYLGASPRLVITPLTDRCYLCLMGALQLDLGGAPAGPAGTGKTETTKDLAKALAFMCVVFNCSEGLDFKMMGRFFAGLAQSGGWCCFDEFNRIDIEVLSVIAQQLITIRLAKVAKLARFMFEGREIKLVRTCAAFITMNPGYAGRTELPDNLKALFRPLSMMVPDYTLIAEVILYSEGFESSKSLANKMTQMYKLCSEQLSQQDHYDFGMRAVKSVLVMAGSLKRANPDINENVVLIRALRDSNSAKFLAADNILFNGIIQDLFPGVVIPEQDYGVLQKEAVKCATNKGLQTPECFTQKIIQLFDTMVVRHGVMLVGPTGGGKTTIYETLKAALASLYASKVDGPFYKPVDTFVLNPKAVSIGELYGEVNPLTFEWRDGLLGLMVRQAVKPRATYHQWIVCDGPVDAIWIENLNTVLDDNKMLCLANSERIKLTNWVRMLFEVQDLSQASPATVSRCGMVYVDPIDMGWAPYVESWLQKLPSSRDELKPYLQELFWRHLENGLQFVKKSCQEIMAQSTIGKVSMTCSILQAMLTKRNLDYDMEAPKFLQLVCQIFMFAYLWSIGGNIHEKDHEKFSQFVRSEFETEEFCKLPKTGQLWSYYNNLETRRMELWEKIIPSYVYDPSTSFVDVLVPTVDTVRFGFLMELLLEVNRAVLFTGPTGTGKSAIAKYVLQSISTKYNYVPVLINFSAQTTSKRTQEMIEGKLERRKKTLLSAPMGKKVIVLIDDINMPKLDRYGSQPSIELIRQLLDFNGCYDRTKLFWKELQNVLISAACAPPGGGRNAITPRLLRHFCMLAIPTPNQNVLKQIYRAIMRGFLDLFDPEIKEMADSVVNASIDIYQFMAQTFLPTPAKSHYVFNMRDLSKCIQGVLQANRSVVVQKKSMVRLFFHEAQRVFHDRLTDEHDRMTFCNSLAELCTKTFDEPTNAEEMKGILYGDFMKMRVDKSNRVYDEITNKERLKHILTDYLDEYNISTSKELQLVFFEDAIKHVTRIARILRTDRGNALLVGVGGSGKQSLTKLSTSVCGYHQCFQIELMRGYDYSSFHDDLKKLYEVAGMKNEPIVFLFTDTQIAMEEFLEDINNILNSGEVPNLLEPEDLERMMAPVRADAKNIGILENDRDAIYDYFIRRVRSNLHIVLCMSPVGDNFRIRTRMFPSIINCCTIDWYNEWPTEALLSVAKSFISKIELGRGVTADAMAEISVFVHESVTKMSERFYAELKRRYYITPSSYLELINLYISMLNERREKIRTGKSRIQNGLSKLLETNELVAQMKIELKELEPILLQKSDGVATLMVKLAEDQAEADIVRKRVQEEEATAKEKAIETQNIAEEAQQDLAIALPALNAAAEALNSLDKNDINEIRSFIKPPPLVHLVMGSVCVLFGVKEDWNSAKNLLTDARFLKKLLDYEAGTVTDAKLKLLKPYIDNPKFQPQIVEKVSKACKSICMWARAVNEYAKVFKVVEPKRNRYLTAQAELDQVMEQLKKAQSELNAVEKKIAQLQKIYQDTLDEKQQLEDTMELTAARLRRAGKLTSALASEQTRWAESVKNFDADTENLIGDVFVGAACVAYFGAFSHHYRQILIKDWIGRCVDLQLPLTPNFTLVTFADPFEIRVWNSFGLPRDFTSTENAILATRGRRWPFMIDPQDQGNRWIKQMENDKGLKVMRFSDATFMRTLENCVRLGTPALLEECGETLDPSLEPILLRQTFVQAGRTMIRLGDTNVDYDANFRLYLTTKLANPVFLPEVCIKVTVINMTVTMKGLEDQLLGDVVGIERPDLESERQTLITQINSDKNQLISLESKILRLLFQSEGNILDDEELINALNESKETSAVIIKRLAEAEISEEAITLAREKYRPISTRGSVLYFVVAQLAELDPMYQYSLKYFTQVFNNCIAATPSTEDLEERLRVLKRETTLATYTNISRGLFEKDKLVFSFILCTDILRSRGVITDDEWNFFLRGGIGVESGRTPKPAQATWISPAQWKNICDLESTFDFMANLSMSCLTEVIKIHIGSFRSSIFAPQLPTDKQKKSTEKWDNLLSKFQKIILIKSIAEEKLVAAITEFVHQELGQKFIESPAIDLEIIYKDLNKTTPLIFVLSVGSDPMASFYRFASDQGVQDKVHAISLGQGQGPIAEGMIRMASIGGDWIFLQNCHLASSWLPSLERIVKRMSEFPDDVSENYRLFLSSMPTPTFPVSILQESVKVTNEPPKGIRANVRRALLDMDKEFFEDNILKMDWKRIIFGICVFHAVIQERKKFGPLGWNIKYEFNDSDRECCLLNIEMFCKEGSIPWDALEYITGQITYGGRITDPWDQRTVSTILKTYFSKKTLNPKHRYSKSGIYFAPGLPKLVHYLRFVDKFPIIDEPEIFGMHQNANISFQKQESNALLSAILSAQPRIAGGSGAAANDDLAYDLAVSIENRLPQKIDLERANPRLFMPDAKGRTPSMSVFLQQEVDRFNRLIGVIKTSLDQLKKGIKGLVVMSEDLEKMYHSFLNNQVPDTWTRVSYGSTKTLSSWVTDFLLRVIFVNGWLTDMYSPTSYWLSGFFFQQGFLTAVLQAFARKYSVPIDQLKFVYTVAPIIKEQRAQPDPVVEKTLVRPRDGVLIHGLFLEAARWNMQEMSLDDALPAEMNSLMPIIHFVPVQNPPPPKKVYNCPLYKTSVRAGILSTTGHSTNFIVAIDLPSRHDKDYWILNGTALLSQLSD